MAIPDFQTLMLPVLRRLASGQVASRDLIVALADEFGLSTDEREALLPSGRQTRIANRVHWVIAYLNRAGLAARLSRGLYDVTERGRAVVVAPPDRITIPYLRQFPEFREFRAGELAAVLASAMAGPDAAPAATPQDRLDAAEREMREALAASLLDRVRALDPKAFERLIVALLVRMGYGGTQMDAGRHLGQSGDGGVDGVIRADALGLDAVYIQAKRYAVGNVVGSPSIREFAGSLLTRGASKGVFVTTSRFTEAAKADAERLGSQQRIVLVDGVELAELMMTYEVGVRTHQIVKVQRPDLDLYEDDAD